jgi:hypothetical protein
VVVDHILHHHHDVVDSLVFENSPARNAGHKSVAHSLHTDSMAHHCYCSNNARLLEIRAWGHVLGWDNCDDHAPVGRPHGCYEDDRNAVVAVEADNWNFGKVEEADHSMMDHSRSPVMMMVRYVDDASYESRDLFRRFHYVVRRIRHHL